MARNGYTGVSIPETLVNKIDDEIKNYNHGYASRSEFVKDAVRQLLEKVQNNGEGTHSNPISPTQKKDNGETEKDV